MLWSTGLYHTSWSFVPLHHLPLSLHPKPSPLPSHNGVGQTYYKGSMGSIGGHVLSPLGLPSKDAGLEKCLKDMQRHVLA